MRWWFLISVVAVVAYWPARSHACSCAGGFVRSEPSNSAAGVPRNQALKLEGFFLPDTIVLENLDGRTHGFKLHAWQYKGPCGGSFTAEVIPEPALEPNAHYELRAARTLPLAATHDDIVIRFSTGTELLPDPELERPAGELTLIAPAGNVRTSCGPFAATGCLDVDDPTDLELVMRDGDTIINVVTLSERTTPLVVWNMPTCIDLQRRAPTGRRSEPLTFCGDDLKLLAAGSSRCGSTDGFGLPVSMPPPASEDGEPPPSAAESDPERPEEGAHHAYGCGALPQGQPEPARFGLLALLAGLALWRRRRS